MSFLNKRCGRNCEKYMAPTWTNNSLTRLLSLSKCRGHEVDDVFSDQVPILLLLKFALISFLSPHASLQTHKAS